MSSSVETLRDALLTRGWTISTAESVLGDQRRQRWLTSLVPARGTPGVLWRTPTPSSMNCWMSRRISCWNMVRSVNPWLWRCPQVCGHDVQVRFRVRPPASQALVEGLLTNRWAWSGLASPRQLEHMPVDITFPEIGCLFVNKRSTLVSNFVGTDPVVNQVLVAFGANLGHPVQTFHSALDRLIADEILRSVRCSPIFSTPPVGGPVDQPDYANAVVTGADYLRAS